MEFAAGGGVDGAGAVSYTHLDVYKRQERPERRAALLDWLAGELAGGEAVLDAAVKRVTVQADALLVELEELPLCFRVRAQAGGRGAARRVEVTECIPLPR